MAPKYLFKIKDEILAEVKAKISSKTKIVLLCDYDGTLTPIRKIPSMAVLSNTMKDLINKLKTKRCFSFGIVTGRSQKDISKLIDCRDMTIISNHGLQITKRKKVWIHPQAKRIIPLLKIIYHLLEEAVNPFGSALIENKKLTLTVHYRNVKSDLIRILKKKVFEIVRQHNRKVKTTSGKKIIEVRPNISWNKGKAVQKILRTVNTRNNKPRILYMGDDNTDEDVFKILGKNAITVRVGQKRKSCAHYYVKNISEVQKFLEWVDSVNN